VAQIANATVFTPVFRELRQVRLPADALHTAQDERRRVNQPDGKREFAQRRLRGVVGWLRKRLKANNSARSR
jgi:hypothetical protein